MCLNLRYIKEREWTKEKKRASVLNLNAICDIFLTVNKLTQNRNSLSNITIQVLSSCLTFFLWVKEKSSWKRGS